MPPVPSSSSSTVVVVVVVLVVLAATVAADDLEAVSDYCIAAATVVLASCWCSFAVALAVAAVAFHHQQ